MMTMKDLLCRCILTLLILAIWPQHTHATPVHMQPGPETRGELLLKLSQCTTAADSIEQLYNLYDISSDSRADSLGSIIYRLARRHGFDTDALDLLRDMAQRHESDKPMLHDILDELHTFAPSDLQKETSIFVHIYLAYIEMATTPEKELKNKIAGVINYYDAKYSTDVYERLLQQFLQCIFISQETQGELLNQYLDMLERLLLEMPHQSDKLTARLYRQKAYSYTVNSDHRRAVEADRKLLELYDRTERMNAMQGRPYRNLDHMRYNSLSRMLRNYRALTTDEADSIYCQIQELADYNPAIGEMLAADPLPYIFHNMAHANYAAAMGPLQQQAFTTDDHIDRRLLLRALMVAAKATGNDDVLLRASTAYAGAMKAYLDSKLSETLRELQIISEVDNLMSDSTATELSYQMQLSRRNTVVIRIVTWLGGILVLLLVIFAVLYRRYHSLSRELAQSNAKLMRHHRELTDRADELRTAIDEAHVAEQNKVSFIKYISSTMLLPLRSMMEYSQLIINSADSDSKPFLQRFGEVMRENYEALNRIARRLHYLSHDSDLNRKNPD